MVARHPKPPSVALLVLPETTLGTLFGLREVLLAVGEMWEKLTGEATDVAPFDVKIVAANGAGVETESGLKIMPDGDLTHADLVVATDIAFDESLALGGRWPSETAWLRRQYAAGSTVCSVCTGAIVLAEAGLLSGQSATTHWAAANLIEQHYPDVKVEADRVLALAGEAQRIITTGGVASWEDLAIYLINRFRGKEEAIRIAKVFLLGDRSDGQLPFTVADRRRTHDDAVINDLQAWLVDNYACKNPIQQLSERSGLPTRTLARRFRKASGHSPIDYVQTLRIEHAKRLLETTSIPIEDISVALGYEDSTHFRRLFGKRTGTTPAKYRKRYTALVSGFSS